jgi:hypothetical protein
MLITLSQIKNTSLDFVMTFKINIFGDMSHVNYVNAIMLEINGMTDSIYESLMDEENLELQDNIQNLIKILKDLQKSHESL